MIFNVIKTSSLKNISPHYILNSESLQHICQIFVFFFKKTCKTDKLYITRCQNQINNNQKEEQIPKF